MKSQTLRVDDKYLIGQSKSKQMQQPIRYQSSARWAEISFHSYTVTILPNNGPVPNIKAGIVQCTYWRARLFLVVRPKSQGEKAQTQAVFP